MMVDITVNHKHTITSMGSGKRPTSTSAGKSSKKKKKAEDDAVKDIKKQKKEKKDMYKQWDKLFKQPFYDLMRTFGLTFRNIAGIRLGANVAKMGKKKDDKGGGGGIMDVASGFFTKGGGGKAAAGGGKAAAGAGMTAGGAVATAGVIAAIMVVVKILQKIAKAIKKSQMWKLVETITDSFIMQGFDMIIIGMFIALNKLPVLLAEMSAWIVEKGIKIWNKIVDIANYIKKLPGVIVSKLKEWSGIAKEFIVMTFKGMVSRFKEDFDKFVLEPIKKGLRLVGGIADRFLSTMTSVWKEKIEPIADMFTFLKDTVITAIWAKLNFVKNLFTNIINTVKKFITGVITDITDFFTDVSDFFTNPAESISKITSSIWTSFKDLLPTFSIKDMMDWLPDITLEDLKDWIGVDISIMDLFTGEGDGGGGGGGFEHDGNKWTPW